jgi:hypothetical protein
MSFSATYVNADAVVRDDPTESPLYEPDNQVSCDGASVVSFAGGDTEAVGKQYWEFIWSKPSASTAWTTRIGAVDIDTHPYTATDNTQQVGYSTDSWGFHIDYSGGSWRLRPITNNSYGSALFSGFTADGVVIRFAYDKTAQKLWVGVNNTWDGDPAAGTGETYSGVTGTIIPGANSWVQSGWTTNYVTLKSFDLNQSYAAPSGFSAFTAPIFPAAATLTIAGNIPFVTVPHLTYPGVDAFALTGQPPVVDTFIESLPGADSVGLTGYAPELAEVHRDTVSPANDALAAAGNAPTSFIPFTLLPGVGALTLAGQAPSVSKGVEIIPGVGSATLAGSAPTLAEVRRDTVSPANDALSITGNAPVVDNGLVADPGSDALALTGNAPTNTIDTSSYPVVVAVALTGNIPTMWNSSGYLGDMTLPDITAEATACIGTVFAGDSELPAIEGDMLPGLQGDTDLPAVVSEGVIKVTHFFAGFATLPAVQVEGATDGLVQYAADLQLPAIEMGSSTMLVGIIASADLELAPITVEGATFFSLSFDADITLPAVTLDATLLVGSLLQGDAIELAPVEVDASYTDGTALTYQGLSTNAFVLAHSEYTNSAFDGLGRLGTNTYAAMSDGLYRLDGEDDAGVPIEAYFLTGYEDFGNEAMKTQRVAYLGCSSDGPLELMARVDKRSDDLHTYSVERPHDDAEGEAAVRIKLGRGLKGRYWQVGLRNCDGADFRIERLGLGVNTSTRKR